MSKVPKPLMPGVSMSAPPWGRKNICEKVVVCMPVWCASLISAVRACASGSRALSSVLLPTPLLPLSSVVLPCRCERTSSSPAPSLALSLRQV